MASTTGDKPCPPVALHHETTDGRTCKAIRHAPARIGGKPPTPLDPSHKETPRVLGRTLAVEETRAVSGVAITSPLLDWLTAPRFDTTYQEDSNIDMDDPHK